MALREQLNLRLPPEWFDVLAAAALYDGQSVPDYVKALVAQKVAALREDPDIADFLRRKAERAGVSDGSVARISSHRKGTA
jgi:hypothetical protein